MADLISVLEKSNAEAQYDEYAKQILAFKPVLANILTRAVKDFEEMDPKEVEKLIEGEISIGVTPVDSGLTNEKTKQGMIQTGIRRLSLMSKRSETIQPIMILR